MKEIVRPYRSKRLQALVPKGHTLHFVTHSIGRIRWHPQGWEKIEYSDDNLHDYAIEVRNSRGRVVAAVGWSMTPARRTLSTNGTYVAKSMRRRGLATELWKRMLKISGAEGVYSVPVSDEGYTLVESLKEKFGFRIVRKDEGGLEDLEDLRK